MPPLVAVGLLVQADERLEHLLAVGLGDAGPVVLDRDLDHLLLLPDRDADPAGVAAGIVDQVAEAAVERGRPQRQHDRPVHGDLERRRRCARRAGACSPGSARGRWARRSRGPRRGRSPDTPRPAWTSRRRPGAARPAPGRRPSPSSSSSSCIRVSGRAQVVADRGQHLGALADVAQDAVAHQVEGVRRLADLRAHRAGGSRRRRGPCRSCRRPGRAGGSGGSAGAGSRSRSPSSTSEPPTIQASSSQVVVLVTRLRGREHAQQPGLELDDRRRPGPDRRSRRSTANG